MKRVKVAKYTKEKQLEAGRKYREELSKLKYSIPNNMVFILKESWKFSRGLFWAMVLKIIFVTANGLFATYTDKYVVEFALGSSDRVVLGIICAVLIAGGILSGCIVSCADWRISTNGRFKLSANLFGRLMRKKMNISYEDTENPKINDMCQKAYTSVNSISEAGLGTMKDTIVAALQVLAYGGILSMLDPWLILIIGVPAVAGYYINKHKMNWIWNMVDNWQTFDRQLGYITCIGTDSKFSSAKDIRIFGMQRWLKDVYDRVYQKRMDWYEQQDAWEYRHDMLSHIVVIIGNCAATVYIVWLVMNGSIGAGDFVLYFNSIFMLSQAVRDWCDKISAYQWLSNITNYVRAYLELPEPTECLGEKPDKCDKYEIEFRNVSYTYSGAEKPTIKNISFKLNRGEKLAMVGLNGAGKTTLIKLMCGLYEPTEGEILLNGKPIRGYDRREYFKLFGTVFQDIDVLPVTVAENISGSKTDETDMPRVFDCMKKSGIYDKVMDLPQQQNTRLIKSVYEDATDFSGGQMQKLALAKALYKDAPVLLLDEPTAALDPIAEQEMYLSYADFSKGKSSVFISHRLASTRFCDRIILIADGGIAEEGSHAELMALGGKYAELFEMQSSYYNDKKGDGGYEE
ncbi:MAG: ABC transporter ATP-binding protein/permease [Oscillospiraceae bacterium]|nr:ABC transporter ATP-binding protein/permease [Oscillospiraceae bacterium]